MTNAFKALCLTLLVAALGVSFALGHQPGIAMLIGLAVAGFGVMGLVLAVRLIGGLAGRGSVGNRGSTIATIVFLLKLPVYAVVGELVRPMGKVALGCFSAGILLVYFLLVVGAVTAKTDTGSDLSE